MHTQVERLRAMMLADRPSRVHREVRVLATQLATAAIPSHSQCELAIWVVLLCSCGSATGAPTWLTAVT